MLYKLFIEDLMTLLNTGQNRLLNGITNMDKTNKTKCACCGFLTLDIDVISDICPVCFWQKDFYQEEHTDDSGGPNLVSLREARENFKSFGAIEKRFTGGITNSNTDAAKTFNGGSHTGAMPVCLFCFIT